MRKSARNRIIIWSAVSLTLIAVLITAMLCCIRFSNGLFDIIKPNVHNFVGDFNGFKNSSFEKFNPEDINTITVGWGAGEVEVKTSNDYQIKVEQLGSSSFDTPSNMMYKINENGELLILSSKSEFDLTSLSLSGLRKLVNGEYKDSGKLVITIPEGYRYDYSINTASADIKFDSIYALQVGFATASGSITADKLICDNLNIETVSGAATINALSVSNADTDTVSGKISLNGSFYTISSNSVSADLICSITNPNLTNIDIDSVSGSAKLIFPENISGFTVDTESVSGKFNSDFACILVDGQYVYGDGLTDIEVGAVSGNLEIFKAESTQDDNGEKNLQESTRKTEKN